jgi:hypothetical protein
MKELNKHLLKYELVREFFEDALIDANTLSNALLNAIDFRGGCFFTLLPENANLENLYKFTTYGILPQNPMIEYLVNEQMSTYTEIPTVDEEIAEFILDAIRSNNAAYCIFDDVNAKADEETIELSNSIPSDLYFHSFFYKQEIYYLINKEEISQEIIAQGLKVSNAFWHSLCILTDATFVDLTNRSLSIEKLKEASEKTKMIIVGAYDGEGYIFWEKHNS